ncbi:hypothetical protein CDO73_12165 [Saccharibacillus sp. O23]|uniref:DUF4279 domain-containing protein n=1 Tax=Saccharibacillus sp. O23 TaxID=2009338 RepID=UPI000B4E1EFD|nr:DUF4279 domain-containing protein [Saccharibacillus sp. O23]OWR29835.1 hypothetical protein CDO73_12165 [Saccharibacillus sp. O23]
MIIEEIRRAVLDEIAVPRFELTKQYLSVNTLVVKEGLPQIEQIDICEREQTAEVYFPIVGEDYYFVIYLDLAPKVSVRFMGMEAGSRVYFSASSSVIDLEELIQDLDRQPTETWQKGTRIPNRRAERFYEDSGFTYEINGSNSGTADQKIAQLIDMLDGLSLDRVLNSQDIHREIQVVYYGYKDQMWGIHLEPDTLMKLAKLNAHIDIDLYASGPDLPE